MNNLLQNISLKFCDNISLLSLRTKGARIFSDNGLPNKKSENWKYTSLKNLEHNDYVIMIKAPFPLMHMK